MRDDPFLLLEDGPRKVTLTGDYPQSRIGGQTTSAAGGTFKIRLAESGNPAFFNHAVIPCAG
jgi:hypothetical protein